MLSCRERYRWQLGDYCAQVQENRHQNLRRENNPQPKGRGGNAEVASEQSEERREEIKGDILGNLTRWFCLSELRVAWKLSVVKDLAFIVTISPEPS